MNIGVLFFCSISTKSPGLYQLQVQLFQVSELFILPLYKIKNSQLCITAGNFFPGAYCPLIVIDMGVMLRYDAILGLKTRNPFA